MNKDILLIISFTAGFLSLSGQSDNPYTAALDVRKQGVYSHYADSYVANILTGRRFSDSRNQFKQFFLGKYTVNGSLIYDGVLFEDVELQYNLHNQNIVVLLETENIERYITVTLDKVSGFSVYGHDFTRVPGDSVMEKGIYELAYAGETSSVFIKRTTQENREIEGREIKYEYSPINKYYVRNEYGTYRITSKKELLKAYQNSGQLISILKKHKVRFSKKKIEQGLVTAISQLEKRSGPAGL